MTTREMAERLLNRTSVDDVQAELIVWLQSMDASFDEVTGVCPVCCGERDFQETTCSGCIERAEQLAPNLASARRAYDAKDAGTGR
jgi:hypothetical protein